VEFQLKFIVATISSPGSAGSTAVRGLPDGNGTMAEVWIRNEQVADFGDDGGALKGGDMLAFVKATPKGKKTTAWFNKETNEMVDLKNPRQTYIVANGVRRVKATADSLRMVEEFEAGRSTAAVLLPVV
jgi:hypothetical protein